MRRFASRVCLAAGLGMFLPALPAFAEVLVFTDATLSQPALTAVSLRDTKPEPAQAAAPGAPAQEDRTDPSDLVMLVAGLTVIGLVTLWRS